MTREMSRRQLLAGAGGIAAGSVAGVVCGGTTLADPAAGRRAADTAARRLAERAGPAPGTVLWRARVGTPKSRFALLDVAAGDGMVFASIDETEPSGAGVGCAFDAHTGARAWLRPRFVVKPVGVGPGAVFWSTDSDAGIVGIVASVAATGSTVWRFSRGQTG